MCRLHAFSSRIRRISEGPATSPFVFRPSRSTARSGSSRPPKLYWCDTGFALHRTGEPEPRGAHLENLVLQDLLAGRDLEPPRPEVLSWRTADGAEVDFVVEAGRRLVPIEVKTAARALPADAKGLETFLDEYPDRSDGGPWEGQ
ncbi:MAG TPA: DUF4143 domain-containing protein [Candidatus Polarisedimenticolia bacterium]|nr:DUF4143 domain-containing protein [Candidatus Polarisedimenticolia bacterium]